MTGSALPRPYKLFLQRLVAVHVLKDADAQKLFEELGSPAASLQDMFRIINKQLIKGCGLEIATVSIPQGNSGQRERYHALINQNADNVSKKSFSSIFTPHECAYVRSVLEKLSNEDTASRMDLINLRNNLSDPYKMPEIKATEDCLDQLIDEGWVVLAEERSRRDSMNSEMKLGPRAYLELSAMLTDFGLEDSPQLIFHRA